MGEWLMRSARDRIVQSYPSLSREAIQAAISYAADLARERVVAIPA